MTLFKKNRSGYVLIMTLLMIAVALIITNNMFNRGSSYVPYANAAIERQKAILLAHAGLAIIESQLTHAIIAETKKQVSEGKGEKINEEILFVGSLLPLLNRWQTIIFTDESDGFNGVLNIYLAAESGKININQMFDFKTKKFKDEDKPGGGFKAVLSELCTDIEKSIKSKDMFKELEAYLKKRDIPLNDVTELLTLKSFEGFKNNIYQHYQVKQKNTAQSKDQSGSDAQYILTDLFTTASETGAVDPWVLSKSVCKALHIPGTKIQLDSKNDKKNTEIVQKFKVKTDWKKDWDSIIKPLYEVSYSSLPKSTATLLANRSVPTYFSAVIQSKVRDSIQEIYIILERIKKSQDNKTVYNIVARAYYWV